MAERTGMHKWAESDRRRIFRKLYNRSGRHYPGDYRVISVWNMDIIIPEGADAEIHLPTGEVRTVLSGKHHFSHQGKAS